MTFSATTPVPGGSVTTRIQRPNDTVETIPLFDDGNHQDGAENDGVFGTTYYKTKMAGEYGFLFTATGTYNSESYERTGTAVLMIAPANASLTGQYSDHGIDDDGNNLYDWLEVLAEIIVTDPSTYALSADLYAGDTFIAHAAEKLTLEAGNKEIPLRLSSEAISGKQLDGPYEVRSVMLLDESQTTLLIEAHDNVHTTSSYSYRQFGSGYNVHLPIIIRK